MAYEGKERRIHKVFVTRNTEYHTKSSVCVGVRDRESGRWLPGHKALRKPIRGSIRFAGGGAVPNTGEPKVGESMYMHGEGIDIITSTIVEVARPPKAVVASYLR